MKSCCSRLLWQAGYEGHREGEGRVGGSSSPIFIPAPFPRGGGFFFLTLLCLYQKCRSISAWWVLLIWKTSVMVMRAQWAKVDSCIWIQEIPTFPHLLSYPMLPGPLSPRMGGFLSVCRFLLSFAYLWLFPVIKEIGKTKAWCPRVTPGPAQKQLNRGPLGNIDHMFQWITY